MLYGFEPVQGRLMFLRGHARAALERVVGLVRCFVAEPNGPHVGIFHGPILAERGCLGPAEIVGSIDVRNVIRDPTHALIGT